MRTVRLKLAYDGTGFRGWARQRDPEIRTVEGLVTAELGRLLRERPRLSVAGRTDAGVHARGQVASFSTDSRVSPQQIQAALNGRLAPEVVVLAAEHAPEGFDARRSATAREYRYVVRIDDLADPFTGRFEWHRPGALPMRTMRAAARHLVGTHDFASFCRHPGQGKTTVRDLQRLTIARSGHRLVFRLRADGFLHQMVRSVVGTLVAVGDGKLAPDAMESVLEAADRAAAGSVAPAQGLTLERVFFGSRPRAR